MTAMRVPNLLCIWIQQINISLFGSWSFRRTLKPAATRHWWNSSLAAVHVCHESRGSGHHLPLFHFDYSRLKIGDDFDTFYMSLWPAEPQRDFNSNWYMSALHFNSSLYLSSFKVTINRHLSALLTSNRYCQLWKSPTVNNLYLPALLTSYQYVSCAHQHSVCACQQSKPATSAHQQVLAVRFAHQQSTFVSLAHHTRSGCQLCSPTIHICQLC